MISTLPDWVSHWAERFGDRTAIHFEGDSWSWRRLDTAVREWTARLRDADVAPGDRVAVLLLNRPEYFVVEWAAHRVGAVVVPVNVRLAPRELDDVLLDAEPAVVVYEQAPALGSLTEHLQATFGGVVIDVDAPGPESQADQSAVPRTVDEPAALLYTSGTTGRPKGVLLTVGNLEASARMWGVEFALDYRDTHLVCMPLCFAGGFIASSKQVIASGGTMVLLREFEPETALHAIERHRITWIISVPLILQRMRDSEGWNGTDLSSLRGIQSGGATVPRELIKDYNRRGVEISQAYGLSEGTSGPAMFLDAAHLLDKLGSVGRPTWGHAVRLLDPDDQDVSPGEIGEIAIKSPLVFAGYWRQPDSTEAAFVGEWLKTGDLARQDEDGFYFIEGRSKEMIVTGGLNVYPAEVELVVREFDGIADVAVVGLPSADWGEEVVACVLPEDGADLSETEVIAFARERLAGYKTPKRVVVVDEFPLTMSSKIQRVALRQQLIIDMEESA